MSDDALGFEPVDDALRRELRDAAPRGGSAESALDALTPRFEHARRRRQLALAGGSLLSAAAIVLVGAIALGVGGGGGRGSVQVPPAGSPTRDPTGITTTLPVPSDGATTGDAASSAAASASASSAPAPSADGATQDPTPSSAAPTPSGPDPAPVQRTFDSAGGSVTVELANGALAIVSTSTAPGYTQEIHDSGPSRVEVRFRNDDGEWRVRVDLVDGQMVEETTHH
ncbi:MAG TPA: hypothetical protein VFZ17_05560 [Acidimicrobiia bacterium]|nr:hypothetical protein [Acidimicrobiia bacterium]